nr:hypothetical protein [Tanacetum cinerariifolium]
MMSKKLLEMSLMVGVETHGKLPLLEWNQSIQAGKDGTVVANEFCVFDSENEFPPPWSPETIIASWIIRPSYEFEFRKLLEEMD